MERFFFPSLTCLILARHQYFCYICFIYISIHLNLNIILKNFKGHAIEDDALFKQAELLTKTEDYSQAENNYLKIIQIYQTSIIIDDAYYHLAELYLNKINNPEKAKEMYQKIIFEYPSSIYLVEARKKYRKLRGDDIQ